MENNQKNAVEIERKYIIKMPCEQILAEQLEYTKSEILQIYLPSSAGETHRIRRRRYIDKTVCTETRKIRIDRMSSTEIEGEISESRFSELSEDILEGTRPITKVRHTFVYGEQTFEIDVYPNWRNTAIMETELDSREKQVKIPSFIEILREVTGDRAYSNAGMSRRFPEEDQLHL